MLVSGMFRNLETIVVLDEDCGCILQRENFVGKSYSRQYSIIREIFTLKDIKRLKSIAQNKDFFTILETIVQKNEIYAGSVTGRKSEILEECGGNTKLITALNILVRNRKDFSQKRITFLL